ncbi:hypothetical protein [Vibrio amylolyticus]
MKKSAIAILIALTTGSAFAETEKTEDVNYGDPTASFTTVGVSASDKTTQLNGMIGLGSNIFQLDLGRSNKEGDLSYRGRYFHVTDGLGYSLDVLGSENTIEGQKDKETSNTVLAGFIYKIKATDNISVFPMLSAGYTKTDIKNNKVSESGLGQAGVYAMYGFDAGHWVYANPKTTYNVKSKEFLNQVELGGGFMVLDNASIGAKLEYTAENKKLNVKNDSVAWLQANVYF